MTARKKPTVSPRGKKQLTPNDVRAIFHEMAEELGMNNTKSQLEAMAHSAAKQAVQETLMTMGVDSSNPLAAQRIFGTLNDLAQTFSDKNTQADMAHLRAWRTSVENIKSKTVMTLAGIATASAIAIFTVGLKGWR